MPSLAAIQRAMSDGLRNGEMSSLGFDLRAGKARVLPRLSIYRNNFLMSLTAALEVTFPVTRTLADPRFFAYAAHEFIMREPPAEPRLSDYGKGFPRFLKAFPACHHHPLIGEMAALEWAISACTNAGEEVSIPISGASLIDAENGVVLASSLQFVLARHDVLDLWRAHKRHDAKLKSVRSRGGYRVAVMRNGEDIQFIPLSKQRYIFWRMLRKGASLERATERAYARDPFFDILAELLLLFRSGLVTGLGSVPVSANLNERILQ